MPQQAPPGLPPNGLAFLTQWFEALGAVVAQTFSPATNGRQISSPASPSPCAVLFPVLASLTM